ncbi:LLM class flavin-dependent oxidoreductase [Sphingobium phenoxybenzoativorans]|uniref:LLM class flavin-dependent oxidoreductase n=1 Tax=Sphingobium phenoxybenzoativorans TaxID=1592790 RepID=A0A975KBY6_9SPHN|nr:LLM class flavin-dependent oxidoreductase [Sphingobium phenoxybenzoativorans]QUT07848.1 LLM class flavin-dependent oxidoreductase [Sphingobium phenoxybenzoativorans]
MRWGIFSLSQTPDQDVVVQTIDEHMEQYKLAEDLGYDSIWLAEHLFSTYGIVTSTQVLLAAVARATKKIRIGSAISVLPFNHPLRTAGDFGFVDVLSNGRLDFGVGRAYQPHEFTALGLDMSKSREMYTEALDIILRSWTEEKIDNPNGEFWKIPVEVEVLPKPVQKPHPPIWSATVSPESFIAVAESGYNLIMGAPFAYRIYREEWVDKMAESIGTYEAHCVEIGRDPKAAKRLMLVPFYCDTDAERARSTFGAYVTWFYRKVSGHQLGAKKEEVIVKGYETAMSGNLKSMKEGYLEYDMLHKYGAICASDPDGCADFLINLQKKLGIDEFVLWTSVGGLPHENCVNSMKLVMERVVPKVEAACGIKASTAAA